jgi:hypothetical protein
LSFLASVPSNFLAEMMTKINAMRDLEETAEEEEGGEKFRYTSDDMEGYFKYFTDVYVLNNKRKFMSIYQLLCESVTSDVKRKWMKLLCLLLAALSPSLLLSSLIYDKTKFSYNGYIKVLFGTFTRGFIYSILIEVLAATGVRLLTYKYFQPEVFEELKEIPSYVLPWVLKDHK